MASDNINQTPESLQENPLIINTPSTAVSPKKFQIPTDPKLRVLYILAIVIVVLLILSLISFIVRKKPISNSISTPTITIIPSPTPTSAIAIPNDLQFKLDQITKLSQNPDTIAPPQIDTSIGIINN
jgi:hypothetical protein